MYVCCVYSLESPHRGDSNEYTQHIIFIKDRKDILKIIPIFLLTWRYGCIYITFCGLTYPSLEQIIYAPRDIRTI